VPIKFTIKRPCLQHAKKFKPFVKKGFSFVLVVIILVCSGAENLDDKIEHSKRNHHQADFHAHRRSGSD